MTATAPASSAILACTVKLSQKIILWSIEDGKAYLLGIDYIHNDTSLQHACQSSLDSEAVVALLGGIAIGAGGGEFSGHFACVIVDHLLEA